MAYDGSVVIGIEADDSNLQSSLDAIRATVLAALAAITDEAKLDAAGRGTLSSFLAQLIGEEALTRITAAGAGMLETLGLAIEAGLPGVSERAYSVTGTFGAGILSAADIVTGAARALLDGICGVFSSGEGEVRSLGALLAAGVSGGLVSGEGTVKNAAEILAAAVAGSFGGDWYSIGANIIYGIVSGVRGAASYLASSAVEAAKSAIGAAKAWLGIRSPSRRARDEIGAQIPPGIAEGVSAAMPGVLGTVADEMNSLVRSAGNAAAGELSAFAAGSRVFAPAQTVLPREMGGTNVNIAFTGSLAQLGRVLCPVITAESGRLGGDLVISKEGGHVLY